MAEVMRWRAVTWAATLGVVVGYAISQGVTAASTPTLDRQRTELNRLQVAVAAREAQVRLSEAELIGRTQRIRQSIDLARAQVDEIEHDQGSAIDHLKQVLKTARRMRDDLNSPQ